MSDQDGIWNDVRKAMFSPGRKEGGKSSHPSLELLVGYASESLDVPSSRKVLDHLFDCVACSKSVADARAEMNSEEEVESAGGLSEDQAVFLSAIAEAEGRRARATVQEALWNNLLASDAKSTPDCSETRLELFSAGIATEAEIISLESHLSGCLYCLRRLAETGEAMAKRRPAEASHLKLPAKSNWKTWVEDTFVVVRTQPSQFSVLGENLSVFTTPDGKSFVIRGAKTVRPGGPGVHRQDDGSYIVNRSKGPSPVLFETVGNRAETRVFKAE